MAVRLCQFQEAWPAWFPGGAPRGCAQGSTGPGNRAGLSPGPSSRPAVPWSLPSPPSTSRCSVGSSWGCRGGRRQAQAPTQGSDVRRDAGLCAGLTLLCGIHANSPGTLRGPELSRCSGSAGLAQVQTSPGSLPAPLPAGLVAVVTRPSPQHFLTVSSLPPQRASQSESVPPAPTPEETPHS